MCQKCAEDQTMNDQLNSNMIMGLFFGYPPCCIDWFIDRARRIRTALAHGGAQDAMREAELPPEYSKITAGFIPCPECMKKVDHKSLETLIEGRVCSLKYPFDHYEEEELNSFVEFIVPFMEIS